MSDWSPVAPRLASTVVLLRDTGEGLTVFLVRRSSGVGFMAGAHVFPGGRVDPEDHSPILAARCSTSQAPAELGFSIAAIRELFEEAGVFLAREHHGSLLDAGAPPYPELREKLHRKQLDFISIVESQGLTLLDSSLVPFARWITPEIEPKRFDTMFFLASAPEGSLPEHDSFETVESLWITPAAALEQARQGKMLLPPPTMKTLELLTPLGSTQEALDWAGQWASQTVCPEIEILDDLPSCILPGDPRSSIQARAYPGTTRYVLKDGVWQAGSAG